MPVRVATRSNVLHASHSASSLSQIRECFSHTQGPPGLRGSSGIRGPKGFLVGKSLGNLFMISNTPVTFRDYFFKQIPISAYFHIR